MVSYGKLKKKKKSAPKSSFTDGHEIGWRYHDSRSHEKISRIQEWSWTASRPFWAESAIWGELEDSHFTLLFRILSKPQLEAGMWRLYSSSCVDRWCQKLRHGDHLRPTTHFQRPVTWQKKKKRHLTLATRLEVRLSEKQVPLPLINLFICCQTFLYIQRYK